MTLHRITVYESACADCLTSAPHEPNLPASVSRVKRSLTVYHGLT